MIIAVWGPMLLLVVVAMRFRHVGSTKTGKVVTDSKGEVRDLLTEAGAENRWLIAGSETRTGDLIEETRDLIDRDHEALRRSLADARERLARIEGYLRIAPPRR